mmetsp:Transcript_31233/g.89612  ORF Transcript_31233/g.89612 Transcript_31233/m.89612 type:complete len:284 (-) Transcript_31233:666-1517(-)
MRKVLGYQELSELRVFSHGGGRASSGHSLAFLPRGARLPGCLLLRAQLPHHHVPQLGNLVQRLASSELPDLLLELGVVPRQGVESPRSSDRRVGVAAAGKLHERLDASGVGYARLAFRVALRHAAQRHGRPHLALGTAGVQEAHEEVQAAGLLDALPGLGAARGNVAYERGCNVAHLGALSRPQEHLDATSLHKARLDVGAHIHDVAEGLHDLELRLVTPRLQEADEQLQAFSLNDPPLVVCVVEGHAAEGFHGQLLQPGLLRLAAGCSGVPPPSAGSQQLLR